MQTQTREEQLTIIYRVGWDTIRKNKSFCKYCLHYHPINGCKFNRLSTEKNGKQCSYFTSNSKDVIRVESFYRKREKELRRKRLSNLMTKLEG